MRKANASSGQEILLPQPVRDGGMSVEKALSQRRSFRDFQGLTLTLDQAGQLLWAAQGVTDDRRKFRSAPSAGATFPLEVILVAGNVEGIEPGTYRYLPGKNALQRIRQGDLRQDLYGAALGQSPVRDAPAAIIISGIHERTTSRYGPRGQRYVYMEAGHAGQNIHLQAESLGLGTVVIGAFDDLRVQDVLGLSREEVPLYIMPVGK
ncbi:SagB/ThcOx family dehydrogenase [Desulfonatronovibrio hydrogenovorans]|uniref:SagB/ThcOx family dehydrogenase n=1 Tax=Desulfonatronovibrio hydrogenovorans TaxID=53245 RepID=UPI001FC97AD1|nr:SagB/ThcOx family dehydrogenase [Desulfonatronovibrio hydrogenovorans]